MQFSRPWFWALICVALCLTLVTAGRIPSDVRRRDDADSLGTSVTTTSAGTTTADDTQSSPTSTKPKSSGTNGSFHTTASATVSPSAINGNSSPTGGNYSTVLPGGLPIQPVLTPGWGVAGVILLLSGIVYTLIGIKKTTLHVFFSTAYLVSLSTTVLIVYVMNLPLSSGIQGAYVVAVVGAGAVLGGGATCFRELTEGLGCLLGGFCLGMWLLTLKEGGLLTSTLAIVLFIAAFSLVGFAFYFSQYTRSYSLIGLISFAGATSIVLGIDCFTRAGLKEFWAYIWQLNSDLFPLGTETYPLTKGIRVEIALVIIFTAIGVISQMRLWRVIQERRRKRAEEQAEEGRLREEEEAQAGQQIEKNMEREKRQWERAYGNRSPDSPTIASSDAGGSTENDLSEKKGIEGTPDDQAVKSNQSSKSNLPYSDPEQTNELGVQSEQGIDDTIANPAIGSETSKTRAELLAIPESDEKTTAIDSGFVSFAGSRAPSAASKRTSPIPQVNPLPFSVPANDEAEEVKEDEDRSSCATFADDDDNRSIGPEKTLNGKPINTEQGARGLGGRPNDLLRNISHRSLELKMLGGETSLSQPLQSNIRSVGQDDPASERPSLSQSRGSIDATVDGLSQDGGDALSILTAGDAMRKPASFRLSEVKQSSSADAAGNENQTPADIDGLLGVKESALSPAASDVSDSGLTKTRLPSGLSRVAQTYRTSEWAKHLDVADFPETEELKLHDFVGEGRTPGGAEAPAPVDVTGLQQTPENGAPPARAVSVNRRSTASSLPLVPPRSSGAESSKPRPGSQPSRSNSINNNPNKMLQKTSSFKSNSGHHRRRASNEPTTAPIQEEYGKGHFTTKASLSSSPNVGEQRAGPKSLPGSAFPSTQTLIGKRDLLMKNRSSTVLAIPNTTAEEQSELGSLSNYQMYTSYIGQDIDDLPLNQRKEIMRRSSRVSVSSRPGSAMALAGPQLPGMISSETINFDSHQPQRRPTLPSQATRSTQLASFRRSVTDDIHINGGFPMPGVEKRRSTVMSSSQQDLGVHRRVEKVEAERQKKDRVDRVIAERMQTGELVDAHREAIRRMQRTAKDT